MRHSRTQFALMRPGPEITALRQLFGEIVDEPTVAKHLADTCRAAFFATQPSPMGDGVWRRFVSTSGRMQLPVELRDGPTKAKHRS
jgi:hypothetical protein